MTDLPSESTIATDISHNGSFIAVDYSGTELGVDIGVRTPTAAWWKRCHSCAGKS